MTTAKSSLPLVDEGLSRFPYRWRTYISRPVFAAPLLTYEERVYTGSSWTDKRRGRPCVLRVSTDRRETKHRSVLLWFDLIYSSMYVYFAVFLKQSLKKLQPRPRLDPLRFAATESKTIEGADRKEQNDGTKRIAKYLHCVDVGRPFCNTSPSGKHTHTHTLSPEWETHKRIKAIVLAYALHTLRDR